MVCPRHGSTLFLVSEPSSSSFHRRHQQQCYVWYSLLCWWWCWWLPTILVVLTTTPKSSDAWFPSPLGRREQKWSQQRLVGTRLPVYPMGEEGESHHPPFSIHQHTTTTTSTTTGSSATQHHAAREVGSSLPVIPVPVTDVSDADPLDGPPGTAVAAVTSAREEEEEEDDEAANRGDTHDAAITTATAAATASATATEASSPSSHHGDTILLDWAASDGASPQTDLSVASSSGDSSTIVINNNNNNNKRNSNNMHKPGAVVVGGVVRREEDIASALLTMRAPPVTGLFNVVLTHTTADFDSLASAVGLAKLWTAEELVKQQQRRQQRQRQQQEAYHNSDYMEHHLSQPHTADSSLSGQGLVHDDDHDDGIMPTFVVLPRGAHPGVQRFLALHQHLFPIRSLKSLPPDLTQLNRLALVDAQKRERLGPAESLLAYAKHITVYDHHMDQDSDIPATDYVVEHVGSVTTMIVERLKQQTPSIAITEAEATLLALGIHADTGSLCYDSTTARDAHALAWCLGQGASQAAISEHVQSSLNAEQQAVLTQALINVNSTVIHGATINTVLLTSDGFIQGLAAVTQDALELSSGDIFLLALVYQTQSGGQRKRKRSQPQSSSSSTMNQAAAAAATSGGRAAAAAPETFVSRTIANQALLTSRLLSKNQPKEKHLTSENPTDDSATPLTAANSTDNSKAADLPDARSRLRAIFDRQDTDMSGTVDRQELAKALAMSGVVLSAKEHSLELLMQAMDMNGDGFVDFDEFVQFVQRMDQVRREQQLEYKQYGDDDEASTVVQNINTTSHNNHEDSSNDHDATSRKPLTMILIGRVKAGVAVKSVKLNKLLEPLGGGGHAKAASATTRIRDLDEAQDVLEGLVRDLITHSLQAQPTVKDFMMSPVLSVQPHMTERQVEDLFNRYDVRALPVVDEDSNVIGLVTNKEVAAAKQRQWNKEQKRLQRLRDGNHTTKQEEVEEESTAAGHVPERKIAAVEKGSTAVKAWMLQHVQVVEASQSLADVESLLLDADIGTLPVVADGTRRLVGMVTRTDLLRQHRYYHSLPYHNKGFADSIANRQPIIELRKRLKRFDLD